jgi:hypothetical protein
MENFGTVIEFSLAGFQDDKILRQWIESPAIPIVHTLIDRPVATFELIAFATGHRGEGRVDNVLLSIKSKSGRVAMVPKIRIRTCERLELESYTVPKATVRVQGSKSALLVAAQVNNNLESCMLWEEEGLTLICRMAKRPKESRRVTSYAFRRKTNQPKPCASICPAPMCF